MWYFNAIITTCFRDKNKSTLKDYLWNGVTKDVCVSKYLDIVYKNGNFFICHRRTKIIVVRCLNLNALNQYISENIAIYGSFSDYESGLNYSYNNVYSLLKTYGGLDDYDGFLDYSKNDVRNGLFKSAISSAQNSKYIRLKQ